MQYWSVQTELSRTAQALEGAFANFDIERGRALRESWNKLIADYGYQPQESAAQKAQAVFYWLQEMDELGDRQQQREAAVSGLEGGYVRAHQSLDGAYQRRKLDLLPVRGRSVPSPASSWSVPPVIVGGPSALEFLPPQPSW